MSLRQRLGQVWSQWRGNSKARARQVPVTVLPQGTIGRPHWELIDTRSYIESGFNLNAVIYSAVMYKVRALKTAPLRAYTGEAVGPEVLPDSHPLARLLAQPNPYQSANDFAALNTVFYTLSGNAFVYFDRPSPGAFPTAMYSLRPDCVRIVPGRDGEAVVLGYVYVPEGRTAGEGFPILAENMLHVKQPNPSDPLNGAGWGWPPLAAAAQSANIDNDVTTFLKTFFEQGVMFQNAVSFNLPMTPEQLSEARTRFEEIYGGAENWHKVVFFGAGATLARLSPTFDEMGFDSIDARNETRMLLPLGVPTELLGVRVGAEHSTFANKEEARRSFWEDTMLPELGDFEDGFQQKLRGADGSFPAYDLSRVPALRKDVTQLTAAALQMWQMGTPAAIAYQTVGLVVPTYPGADQSKPAGALPGSPVKTVKLDARPVALLPYDARGMQQRLDRLAVSWESRFATAAETAFDQDKREVLALVNEAGREARSRKATIDWRWLDVAVKAYLDAAGLGLWRSTFVALIEGIMVEAGREWAATLGIQFDIRNLEAEAWFQEYLLQFAQPILATTADDLHAAIALGLDEGWSIRQMQDRLGQIFEQYMSGGLSAEDFAWFEARMPAYRRELIARTESMRAEAAGTFELAHQWGVEKKAWLAALDDRTRDSHITAQDEYGEGGTIGPIPLDTPFLIGGYPMQYPLDPAGPIEECANCRCTLVLLGAK